jgi:hypothetical protein
MPVISPASCQSALCGPDCEAIMTKVGTIFAALAMVAIATAAGARDVCLFDGGTYLIFKQVKNLSPIPGKVIPLTGFAVGPSGIPPFSCALNGTAMRTSTSAVRVGTSVYCGNEPGLGFRNTANAAVTDATYEGDYYADQDGDGVAEFSTHYAPVACSSITVYP